MADESDDDTCDQTGENSGQTRRYYESLCKGSTSSTDLAGGAFAHGKGNKAQEKPGVDFVTGQDNATHNPPVYNEDTPLRSAQFHKRESSVMNSKDSTSNADNHPANNHPPTEGSTNWRRNVAVGVAAGTAVGAASVAAAPALLTAAGFTAGGIAAGSIAATIQSVFYGGSVASGSFFALCQSAGAAGIGVAGNAAIGITGGITSGITALGAMMFLPNSRTDIKLLICGSGSEAHAFAGIASSVKGTEVRVLSLYQDEAERWSAAMQKSDLEVTLHRKGKEPTSIKSKPALVTKNPEDAMRDVDIVVFVLPAFAHELYLDAIKPYIKPGTIVVGLPGGPGFQFQVREVLGDVARKCAIVNFESSPWVCRITEFGVKCEVLGTKETLQGAMKF
ncbi:hypothetical protein ACROYT_G040302 [Oculina patagonica]